MAGAFARIGKFCPGPVAVCYGPATWISGSSVAPGDTAAGCGPERACCDDVAPGGTGGLASSANAAPNAATTAHMEPPRLNAIRADLNIFPTLDNDRTKLDCGFDEERSCANSTI